MQDCTSILITGRFKTQQRQAGGEINWDDLMSTKAEEKGSTGDSNISELRIGLVERCIKIKHINIFFCFFHHICEGCNLDVKDCSLDMQGACGRG